MPSSNIHIYKIIAPYRVDSEEGRTEFTYLITRLPQYDDDDPAYICSEIITLKDDFGMILDERISNKLSPIPDRARFNKSARWSRKKTEEFLSSMRRIQSRKEDSEDIERIEGLFG